MQVFYVILDKELALEILYKPLAIDSIEATSILPKL